MKKRPFGVTLLAIFALLAAAAAAWHTLQMLHIAPVFFGGTHFFTFDLFGAILWGISCLIYLWVFRMLWNLNPQGWLFVVVIAVINLILALVSVLGASSWTELLPSILLNALVLIYALMPGVKAAFNVPTQPKRA